MGLSESPSCRVSLIWDSPASSEPNIMVYRPLKGTGAYFLFRNLRSFVREVSLQGVGNVILGFGNKISFLVKIFIYGLK